jgi:L-2,4-diaminobutyrate decarboxylase
MYGRALFAEKIEHLCRTTNEAYRVLAEEPDFETLHQPEANILCFRYRPQGISEDHVHRLQLRIRKQVRLAGRFFISKVNVRGVAALRVVLMNHQVSAEHFRMLLAEVRTTGERLLRDDDLA